jgi:hypothetical protein
VPQPDIASAREEQRPVLIILSHLRWDFVFQRPQHVATRAAADYDVVFIEEPIVDDSGFSLRQGVREGGVQLLQPLIAPDAESEEILAHQHAVLDAVLAATADRERVFWYYTPMALQFSRHAEVDLVVFDKMDELSAFAFAPRPLLALEEELLSRADLVFTGGTSLHLATIGRHQRVHCFPSSIDVAHFGSARLPVSEPSDLAGIAHPRIGFFGVIDERIDLALIADMASARPDWQIVMIGPTAKIDPKNLPHAPNIHWLGPKAYAQLPSYLAHFDIGWMPFAMNEATRFISPTKTPEFLAAGVSLISTPVRDVVDPYGREGLVKIAAGVAEHIAAAEALLAQAANEQHQFEHQARVDLWLTGNSWDQTWIRMRDEMQRHLAAKPLATTAESKEAELV